jgi:hypothetical protein
LVYLKASHLVAILVLLDALLMAFGHMPLALGLSSLFRAGRPPPPPGQGPPPGTFSMFFFIGVYFLVATIIYFLGGILVASGKLFKLANIGLILMAVIDNALLIYTRTMPNVFFPRILGWSEGWFPSLGTVQILIGQFVIIVLSGYLLIARRPHTAGT